MALRSNWRDIAALLIAGAALVASIGLWGDGRVAIGLELGDDPGTMRELVGIGSAELLESGELNEERTLPGVWVVSVTPDGNAARHHLPLGSRVIALTTTDGRPIDSISEVTLPGSEESLAIVNEFGEPVSIPTEAVAPGRISGIVIGDVYLEGATAEVPERLVAYGYQTLEREWLESTLNRDVYGVGLGLLVGLVVSLLLGRGWLGEAGRRVAVAAGVAVALPLLLIGVVEVGDAVGINAVYLALITSSLLLAIGLSERLDPRGGRRAALAVSLGAAGVAAALVVRHMRTPELSPDERGPIAVLLTVIAFAPALVVAVRESRTARDRAGVLTLGVLPAIGALAIMPSEVQPALPPIIVAGVLLTHGLPWERASDRVAASFARVRSSATSVGPLGGRSMRERRDLLVLSLVGASLFAALTQDAAWAIALAGATGIVIWLGIRQGVLGPDWTDAATPLAASVAIPILLAPMSWGYSSGHPAIVVPTALTGLAVAHLLAERHSNPSIGARLFLVAVGFALLLVATSLVRTEISIPLVGLIPLIPAMPVAFAERSEASAVSWPLESLAVALTPLVATSVIAASGGGVLILGGWLAALVVWRYFALNPLIGLARRTELQRDVAVAAAETERARLAADLHDDALQQLTMLVRTLDEKGQKKEADEAREIATKLRSVVGDLRLPILDDLGAGAALEWLVERVEPLAGGSVKLERSDETRPPANVELAVFRVAQEALTNAIKHGKPPIAVRYDVRTDGRVTLAIDDAGEGIGSEAAEEAPKEGHFGLVNMQQRAEQIGALLDVRRWPAGGTRVALEWRPQ